MRCSTFALTSSEVFPPKARCAGEAFEQNTSQSEEIGSRIDDLVSNLFGRHVTRRPDGRERMRQLRFRRVIGHGR